MKLTNAQEALQFVAFIEEALPYVDMITPTTINQGGCGIFAKLLFKELKGLDLDPKVIALFGPKIDISSEELENSFVEFLHSNRAYPSTGVQHMCVKVDDLYIDSRGIINEIILAKFSDRYEITEVQLDELLSSAGWNDAFDKSCAPKIEENLDRVFAQLREFKSGIFEIPDEIEYTEHTKSVLRDQQSQFFQ
jgi:hypothetical protein